jgi:hypothetical protein
MCKRYDNDTKVKVHVLVVPINIQGAQSQAKCLCLDAVMNHSERSKDKECYVFCQD